MILTDIRDYLRTHRLVTADDLANRFDLDRDALRGMLGRWIARGRVKAIAMPAACGVGCDRCALASVETYAWVVDEDTGGAADTRSGGDAASRAAAAPARRVRP